MLLSVRRHEAQVIAQTLHGYDQGHRLLAVGGDVDDSELSLLDRLSDLSGYVPLGTEFDQYHTGFLCERYYAFACTWPDRTAPRAGTVLTHTLLVPRDVIGGLRDLWSLGRLHRRPESAADREAYTAAISSHVDDTAEPPMPVPARARSAVLLWFGQADRPVLWVDETRPDDVVRYLWSLLWPDARQRLKFCTFALQVRYVRRQPFGFLALPPSARGSFHERARSAAWWQEGALGSVALRERTGDGWVQDIVERGAEATWAMPRFCDAHVLPFLDEALFPLFRRFVDLETPAGSRLTAARARADLLVRLWPDVVPTHPLVRTTLGQLLERQADPPLSPRRFWELGDFVGRPAVRALMDLDAEFASTLADVVANETRRRLLHAAPDGVGEFMTFLQHAPDPRLHFAILNAVRSAVGSIADEDAVEATVRALLQGATEARDPLLAEAALAAVPPARRTQPTLQALQGYSESDRDQLTDHVLTAAHKLDDPLLVVDVWTVRGEPARGLRDATSTVLAASEVHLERLRPILARSSAEDRLAWALNAADARIAAWAGERGAEAAEELRLSIDALLDRCQIAPNGVLVLLSRLASLPTSALPDEKLLSAPIATALASEAAGSPFAKHLVEHATLRLVHRLAEGTLDAAQRAIWLYSPAIQAALTHTSPWTLFGAGGARASDRDCLPNLAKAVSDQIRPDPSAAIFWVPNLLSRPLDEAWSTNLGRAVDDLAVVLAIPTNRDGWPVLAAATLVAVRRTECSAAHRLVEQTFPVLYPLLVTGELDSQSRGLLSRFSSYGWDVARSWRHWLLDAWLNHRWPPASFLVCLGGDEALFYRIAQRARWKWHGRDFLKSLRDVVNGDAQLGKGWAGPVARALGGDALPTDYD